MKEIMNLKNLIIASIIILGITSRLIIHQANFVPVMAIALISGAFFTDKRLAFGIPLITMFISDIIIGLHNTIFAVYLSFAIAVLIGMTLLKQQNVWRVISGSLLSSIVFFLITNFAVWLLTNWYTNNLVGVIDCYTLAIPFFRSSLLADLFYSCVLFGSIVLSEKYLPANKRINSMN